MLTLLTILTSLAVLIFLTIRTLLSILIVLAIVALLTILTLLSIRTVHNFRLFSAYLISVKKILNKQYALRLLIYVFALCLFFSSRYLLKAGGDGLFRLEHTTGKIRIASLLDYVIVPKVFTLEIEAHDKGLLRLSTKAIVKIKVVDKETPIFDQLSYGRVLREDVKKGHEVSRVQARSPGGADIFYTIVQGDPLNQFTIDLKTGKCSDD